MEKKEERELNERQRTEPFLEQEPKVLPSSRAHKYSCNGAFQEYLCPTQEYNNFIALCRQCALERTEKPAKNPQRKWNVLLGLSGSIASVKVTELITQLIARDCNVVVVPTKSSTHFLPPLIQLRKLGATAVLTDVNEWAHWKAVDDPVLHIELRQWADALLIAPLSANTLAKLATGICDNLLTSTARAWDFTRPFVVAPAMNTLMWEHPFTVKQLQVLRAELGVLIIPPKEGLLGCNTRGVGAMADPAHIVETVLEKLGQAAEKAQPKQEQCTPTTTTNLS